MVNGFLRENVDVVINMILILWEAFACMTRILVVSDSHGTTEYMTKAIRDVMPDMMIHLGDGWQDAVKIRYQFPDLYIEQVPGNCDYIDDALTKVLDVEGKKLLICHGHEYSVKMGYGRLLQEGIERKVDAILCGHTHIVLQDIYKGMVVLNPGSIGDTKVTTRPTYGILEVTSKKINMEAWCI